MIILVNPPNPPNAVSNKDTMGGFGQLYPLNSKIKVPPIDILYIAAILRGKDIPVKVIDCLSLDWKLSELLLHLKEQPKGLIAIRTSSPTFDWDMRVAHRVKMTTNSEIILFGPHVTLFPQQALQHVFVDAIVIGEPEMAFLEIMERGGFNGCQGVCCKEGGNIKKNEKRGLIDELDRLPFPAWDLVPYRAYDGVELMYNIRPFVTALTSRGCPYGCAYCPYPVSQGRKMRLRSPKNVVDELEWLTHGLGVQAVLFRDPEFAFNRDRVVGICEGIFKHRIQLAWRCETRIEDLDEELIYFMAKAGCIGINVGVESADEEILHNMGRRPMPLKRAKRIIKICKKNDIDAFCFFILGLPGETKESALKSINYALKLNPSFIQFTVATPYPGTGLRRWAENKGFIDNDSLSALTGYEAVMRNEYMTIDEIQGLQRFAYEARDMQWTKMIKRVSGNSHRAAWEVKRWLCFKMARLRGANNCESL